ncbi:unnamed protein product [Parnassius apollo]|uniref:(apollo) hypothetical protein n=1 Tax=Parnassius apollo TaxID=110799 RepID=A0A8S3Y1W9_PARAO|nr:unnamed protein product [Parnassius apollo]
MGTRDLDEDHILAAVLESDEKPPRIDTDSEVDDYESEDDIQSNEEDAKRLDMFKMVFPIGGHSYLECDKNMALINQKAPYETPEDWRKVVSESRLKPSPFRVIDVDQPLVRSWTKFLSPKYKKTCPFLSTPISEIRVDISHPRLIFYRDSYNGQWTSSVMLDAKRKRANSTPCADASHSTEFILPDQAYKDILPISKAKFLDVQSLSKYCRPVGKKYYSELKYYSTT